MPVGGQQLSYLFCSFVQRHRITELHVQPPCLLAFLSLPLALGFRETASRICGDYAGLGNAGATGNWRVGPFFIGPAKDFDHLKPLACSAFLYAHFGIALPSDRIVSSSNTQLRICFAGESGWLLLESAGFPDSCESLFGTVVEGMVLLQS